MKIKALPLAITLIATAAATGTTHDSSPESLNDSDITVACATIELSCQGKSE